MVNENFWEIVRKYNDLMKAAIDSPNCIDPNICHGDCCSIKIDVPKVLAEEYIKNGWAKKDDFVRSNVFSFHLRFDDETGKCFLFDKSLNGCSVHKTGIKPPQCWIYPTKFSNPENNDISCKRAKGWSIVDPIKAKEAEDLLQKYISVCQIEAKEEIREINQRIDKSDLKFLIESVAPSQLGGFKDTWDGIKILSAEGLSLTMKKFCSKYNEKCTMMSDNFFECKAICEKIAEKLITFLRNNINDYVKKNELDVDGHYPLYKFLKDIDNK
jgi:hypothetical protein